MSPLEKELIYLILQFLNEMNLTENLHKLEKESGIFFNMRYFDEVLRNGEWEIVENYLSGFTKIDDNLYSMKMFFEIRKQKYIEALDKRDHARAVEILSKELKFFSTLNEGVYKELVMLLTVQNFRDIEHLSKYNDIRFARLLMASEVKTLIESNPIFWGKLQFPMLRNSRLRTLINQSLNWQHHLCPCPKSNPDVKSLFVDHSCGQLATGALTISCNTNPSSSGLPKVGGLPSLLSPGWNTPSMQSWPLSAWHMGATSRNNFDPSIHVWKRPGTLRVSETNNQLVPYTGSSGAESGNPRDDIPKVVVANLYQGQTVTSMDFHPVKQTLLLVGTHTGDISLWDVATREMLALREFKAAVEKECVTSVNCVVWSPEGNLLGVAYLMNLVHLYTYYGGGDLRTHHEIDAHVGNVNDLGFSNPNKKLCITTCGEDMTIKVWNATTGVEEYAFERQDEPTYSVCPHYKENIPFLFSIDINGKIKAWLYDSMHPRLDQDAPGYSPTTLVYSANGTRLFSCGTSNNGETFTVEWDETEGDMKWRYLGLATRSIGVVKFDVANNRILAAGDEFTVKFWDMNNENLLTTTNADGGLLACPYIQFSKNGKLLAVSTNEKGVKILSNGKGLQLLSLTVNRALMDGKNLLDLEPNVEESETTKIRILTASFKLMNDANFVC